MNTDVPSGRWYSGVTVKISGAARLMHRSSVATTTRVCRACRSVAEAIRRPRVARADSASRFARVQVERRVRTSSRTTVLSRSTTPSGTCADVRGREWEVCIAAPTSCSGVRPVAWVLRRCQPRRRSPSGRTCLSGRVTRATRPDKHVRPLGDLLRGWQRRSTQATGRTPEQLVGAAMHTSHSRPLTSAQVPDGVVDRLSTVVLDEVLTRRSTWTRANLLAESARATRGLRMASATDRHALHTRVVVATLDRCISLAAPEIFTVTPEYQRPDGTSVFIRAGEDRYTDHRILEAEARLLATLDDVHAPTARPSAVTAIVEHTMQTPRYRANVRLAPDQVGAVRTIATSGNRLEVLVGPAGTGKTTTLLALARAWTATHGSGSVIGLAPSATAAAELADALGIACENTAKWLYESTGPGRTRRAERTAVLQSERAADRRSRRALVTV